ncbi:PREDICTED: uncharacterized protein LOC109223168 [Nicotiana attenuata]|uniref:Uncharacterized protein n=1 Tax=Nicotiana attenuata TaxID=49451 RepID=A0A1J6IZM7_NICAT|nr:PREDICTED: uncharacterized protein LOC109223168 [Nicotiana attenuata]OIT04211.1 hypothetical protein A4A49_31507 [Nicotiana attenuata]
MSKARLANSGTGQIDRREAPHTRIMLPPNLGWGRKRGRGIPARQVVHPIIENEVIPPSQPPGGGTTDVIAAMLHQAMESLLQKVRTQSRVNAMSERGDSHNQNEQPLGKLIQEFLELKLPVLTGASETEDPQLFLDGTQKALDVLECTSARSVALADYCLQDVAEEWFKPFKAG